MWVETPSRSEWRSLTARLGLALLLSLAACSEQSNPPSAPSFMMDYDLIGCDPVANPGCVSDTLSWGQRQFIQENLFYVLCPENRQWIIDNIMNINVFEENRGYWGLYDHSSGQTQLWSEAFNNPLTLMQTLVHESAHARYPLLGDGNAYWTEATCVGVP